MYTDLSSSVGRELESCYFDFQSLAIIYQCFIFDDICRGGLISEFKQTGNNKG